MFIQTPHKEEIKEAVFLYEKQLLSFILPVLTSTVLT